MKSLITASSLQAQIAREIGEWPRPRKGCEDDLMLLADRIIELVRRDRDAAATAALCEDIAVPQDQQARPSPKAYHTRKSLRGK